MKNVLVTGASRGIGQAIALTLAQNAEHRVFVTATTLDNLKGTVDMAAQHGHTIVPIALNVCDAAACEAAMGHIEEQTKQSVSILINNAGITKDMLALRMKDEEWASVIETNLTAVFRLSKLVLRGMVKARWGRIINITSVVGSSGNAGQMNYAASKAGVAGMTRALAQEIANRGITVNCVAPGFIDTDMTKGLSDEQKAALMRNIPCGRLGQPQDIAQAVAFLASEGAGYITGETLHINGGLYMAA